ncbi:MAG TPA: hypothetical protein VMM13_00250 [Euzebya sp.]|nr:hypothetical protein [Euzebya sp.]
MKARFRILGFVLAIIGLAFVAGGVYAYTQVQAGYDSLQAFSEAQDVQLNYNEDGQLVDRGETAGAEAIMSLLVDDWGYPVVAADLDPDDPLVNTPSEYMYQMATIGYHVLNGTQTIVLEETVEFNGETFEAGPNEFDIDGRYWTDFDREHPLEGPARDLAWSGTAHGLIGELGVGTVTGSTLQMGLGLAALLAGLGATFILAGLGLAWAASAKRETSEVSGQPESEARELINA